MMKTWTIRTLLALTLLSTRSARAFAPRPNGAASRGSFFSGAADGSSSSSSQSSRTRIATVSRLFLADLPREYLYQQRIEPPEIVQAAAAEEEESEAHAVDRLHRERLEKEATAQQQDWTVPHALLTVNAVLAIGLFVGVGLRGGTPVVAEPESTPTPTMQLHHQQEGNSARIQQQQQQQQQQADNDFALQQQYLLDQSQGFFFF